MNNKDQSKEHRQNYSMGAGYFLTNNNYIRHSWHIKKHVLPSINKAQQVPLGELGVGCYLYYLQALSSLTTSIEVHRGR